MSDINSYQECNVKVVINKKLKHSYVSIDRDTNITIKTPHKSKSFAVSLLQEKETWIQKQLIKIQNMTLIENDELHSKEFMQNRVVYFSKQMGLVFEKLKFRKMKSSWGSCNSKKEITLNSELSRLNKNLVDYVIVHELAHLRHMNHSKDFHNLVSVYLKNAKELRAELKKIKLLY